MGPRGRLGRIAGAGAALAIPLLPKCPLCVLPIAAAAGVALPHGPAVEAAVTAIVGAWLATVLATARWLPVRLAAAAAAAAILGGRWLEIRGLGFAGGVLMLGVALWIGLRPRRCASACPAAPVRTPAVR